MEYLSRHQAVFANDRQSLQARQPATTDSLPTDADVYRRRTEAEAFRLGGKQQAVLPFILRCLWYTVTQ